MSKYHKLFEHITLPSGVTLKNRLVMAPMTTWAGNEDLTVSDEEISYYRSRVNGVGMVITGCTHVTPNGQGFTDEFASYDDKFIPSLRRLAETIKANGSTAVLQIFHAGSRTLPEIVPNGDIVSASPVKFSNSDPKLPRELTGEEILEMIRSFGEATRRAIEAGFDGVEIHGAHAFLLQNFYAPSSNRRTDHWGGSLENRLRFPLAVVEEIQNVIEKHTDRPFILGYRLSPEFASDGLLVEDTYHLVDRLTQQKLDYIHLSLDDYRMLPIVGTNEDRPKDKTRLELILEKVDGRLPVIATGSVKTPEDALAVLEKGAALAGLGKALIINPDWVERTANGRGESIETVMRASRVEELGIPDRLWTAMKEHRAGRFTFTD